MSGLKRHDRVSSKGKPYHWYTHNGKKLPGVTTVIGKALPKPALVPWAARSVAEFVADNPLEVETLRSGPRDKMVAELKETPYRERDAAANRGTEVHGYAERLVKGEEVTVPPELAGYVDAYVKFLDEWQPRPVLVEATVANLRWGYAGQLDLVADLPNGERAVLDLKGLALETPIPTPFGWATMRSLRVGDQVFDSKGQPCKVTAKSNVKMVPCYRATFDDGSEIIADGEHRWATVSGALGRPRRTVLTTTEIAQSLRGPDGQRQHRVEVADAIQQDEIPLPVEPYTLGCWLGDGTASDGSITKPDDEFFELIAEASGLEVGPRTNHDGRCPTRTVYGLRTKLRIAGLLNNKHIPHMYLRASEEQRLALLQGLMDSDGSWNKTRGRAVFCTVSKALAYSVQELALTLGERVSIFEVDGFGFGKPVTRWDVTWKPTRHNPFKLTRKSALVDSVGTRAARARHRIIKSVEPTVTVPTQCIEVDSPDHTYLCSEHFIPTHNTSRGVYPDMAVQVGAYRHAEVYLDDDGNERPMADLGITTSYIVHVRASGYQVFPVDSGEGTSYKTFLHLLWLSRRIDEMPDWLGDPAPTPAPDRDWIGLLGGPHIRTCDECGGPSKCEECDRCADDCFCDGGTAFGEDDF